MARRPITLAELCALPDDERRYELQGGYLVSEPPPGFRHGSVAARLCALLDEWVRSRKLGAVTSDVGFVLAREPDTVRAPDVSFVSRKRVEAVEDLTKPFPGAPDLAVEVVSPGQPPGELHAKVADYLAAGTRLVWVVDPAAERIMAYRTLLAPRVLEREHTLEGEEVVPGFAVDVRRVFES